MLDRRYDDVATLEYVVQDYLERRFNQDAVVQPLATPITFSAPLDLDVTAYLDGELQRMPVRLIKSADSGWAVLGMSTLSVPRRQPPPPYWRWLLSR